MQKSIVVYAVIPARGGSKDIPRKNLRLCAGKPLITYIIATALRAPILNKVFVSTEDNGIASIAASAGATVIRHPARLSVDRATSFGVVRYAVRYWREEGEQPDIVVILRPTAPLCAVQDIQSAAELLMASLNADSVTAVTEAQVHPYRVCRINRYGQLKQFDERSPETRYPKRRQTFGKVYVRTGGLYISRRKIIESGRLWGERNLPYVMPRERAMNINDELDFHIAEMLLQRR